MEIKDLETFLLIVQTGSFTEAAKTLYLTQPGISRRIRRLEEELQNKLFEKVGNSLLLTAAGRDLVPYAQDVLDSVNQLKRAFERRQGVFSKVTLVLSTTLAGTTFSAKYMELQRRFSNVESFELRLLNDDQLSVSVVKGESDIGVRFLKDDNPNLGYHLLHEDPFVLVTAAGSQWFAHGLTSNPDVLSGAMWLMLTEMDTFFDPITQIDQLTKRTMAELGISPCSKIECYGWGVTKSLVQQDHGIAFLPYSKVAEEVESGELVVIELPLQPVIPLYGIYRKNDVHAPTWLEIMEFLTL
ncbi:LysR family transcriptional regulator [Tumebacillus flagellatus]|uniref:HTH lysR-type domain-containing protein n=1 Tax=Tumebacillus flagellatus TaxID=1157490 RepID=A0A074LLA0_9BACL|nr:LysR family transcriptional regulator [Tumebacillus flagellatus]KEO81350.1 hypothetical protein EL26_21165 [Tumebacillus flagellatus]